jgi:hypothetical protein
MVMVLLTCLPGYGHRALVKPATAELLVAMNLAKRLEPPDAAVAAAARAELR